MSTDEPARRPRSIREKQLRLLVGVPVLAVALAALVVLTVAALQLVV